MVSSLIPAGEDNDVGRMCADVSVLNHLYFVLKRLTESMLDFGDEVCFAAMLSVTLYCCDARSAFQLFSTFPGSSQR